MKARTRFAPSPTGYMHVGGVRTALFAWLIAQQSGGQFILRIEDTDKTREVAGSEKHIIESLKWLGLQWQEGPDSGGPHGPYRQSERLDIYKQWARKLINDGRAYADPYSPSQLDELRTKAKTAKKPFLFRDHRPQNPPDWDGNQPLRFRSEPKDYEWHDAVLGKLHTGPEVIDDFILIKSDGYPTYNFAHIIDDHLMQITHVIRSQEFLPSVPKFLNLYEALKIEPPILATLPYVMGPDGQKKLSKRDGAKDILDYKKEGYLPEALINFLASLGWNDGTEQEIFTVKELLDKFDLARVQRGGARFDEKRLLWTNGYYIRGLPIDQLTQAASDYWPQEALVASEDYRRAVLALVQERLKFFAELPSLTGFFFAEPKLDLSLIKSDKRLGKITASKQAELLRTARAELANSDFSLADLTDRLNNLLDSTGEKPAILFSLVRIAITWAPASPGLADTLGVLGKQKSLSRLDSAISALAG